MNNLLTKLVIVVAVIFYGISGSTQEIASNDLFPDYAPTLTLHNTPNISGVWQSFTTANWNILSHPVQAGPFAEQSGAWGAGRAGFGIVEGNELPYQEWAVSEQQRNHENRAVVTAANDPTRFDTGDPELLCFRAGVPRANYMPYPFQIFQTPEQILIVYEYKGAYRTIYMNEERPALDASWMGTSNGHWEGNTLVVDVKGFNEHTWFDREGNFASDDLHVVERWTPLSPYHMKYEATIEDPNVFTRPWKMSFILYKHVEENAELKEFNCVPLVEPMFYKPLGFYDEEIPNNP
ncbi:MAG: hypothetical protein CMD52_04020 [Gammaproteobacteria bacterium]|nr:hypothetical protein [Gammaproteobacteria bacterium]